MSASAPASPVLMLPIGSRAGKTTHLVEHTTLVRVYSQPARTARRDIAFNPYSNGRASPVHSKTGAVDAAMYVAIDSAEGAAMEVLHHAFIKNCPPSGAVVPISKFADLRIVRLKLLTPIDLVSVELLQQKGVLAPPTFSAPRTDYTDTQDVSRNLYTLFPNAAGITWHSARGNAVVASLYESRMPKNAFKVIGKPVSLVDSDTWSFVLSQLAFHRILVKPIETY